jgi:hypothetical protein
VEILSDRTELSSAQVNDAIGFVNRHGYAALKLPPQLVFRLGEPLYLAMDAATFHACREKYYNEIAFYWPEDWDDVDQGICSFHEHKSLRHIFPARVAKKILTEKIGRVHSDSILNFASQIKRLVIQNHHGLKNNELRISRVMVRQMNDSNLTTHSGSEFHEDIGYSDRPYQQLLSVSVTTHGIPTESAIYQPKAGELLLFNAYDRRRVLGLNDEFAFVHKGPKTGPKMFFFFEFLGPRE